MQDEMMKRWFERNLMWNYPKGSFKLGSEPRIYKKHFFKDKCWHFEFSSPDNDQEFFAIQEGEFQIMLRLEKYDN